MMCAHSPPLAADAPAGQHLSEKILDGGPSVLGAILTCIYTLLALAAIVVCIGPFWDWLAVWLLTIDSPLVSTVMPLFKWLWLLIALSVIAAFAYILSRRDPENQVQPADGGIGVIPHPRAIIAIAVLALIYLTTPVCAETTLIDEDLVSFGDSVFSISPRATGPAYWAPVINLRFKTIESYPLLNYVAITIPVERISIASGAYLPEGEHTLQYWFSDSPLDKHPLLVRATAQTNQDDDVVIAYRYVLWFSDWDIGSRTGTGNVVFSERLVQGAGTATLAEYLEGNPDTIYLGNKPNPTAGIMSGYSLLVVGGRPFANHLTVTLSDIGVYSIALARQIDGEFYPSTLTVYNGGSIVANNTGPYDFTTTYYRSEIDQIDLDTGIKVHSWPLIQSTSPITIHIRDAATGNPLNGARIVIVDSTDSTEAVNQTLTSGTGTFILPRADDHLRYHASATASGYTLLSPILFGVPDDGATIVLWLSPDAPPDDPIEEGKSMLYGYVQTQGSQQPISGATVSLNGYGSTTTSSTGFYLFNNVTPGSHSISASAPLHDALSEPVTVDSAPTQHNLALKGHYSLTITVKDGDTLANVQNATISLSDGQESTQNPATFTADYGPYVITAAAGGYYPQTQSAYLDKPGTTTATVLLTAKPEPIPPPEMPNYPPHNVKFTIQTLLGTPIPGVNVTAQGIQQTPSSNIIERLLGINMTSTPINSELMSGTTDTNGEINFMMIEAVKYRISLYKPDSVNQTLEIYPKEDTYPIIISTAGGPLLPDAGDALRDIRINVTTSTEGDTGHILVDYNDTTRKTTGLSIQVTQQNTTNTSAPEDVIASHTVANDANVTHTFDLPDYKGQSFFVRLEAEHPDFGTVHRDYAVAFKGVRVPLGPLPDGLYIYVAGFGLMLLGGIFGATSATRGVVVIAFAGWLFWGFGWLDDLGLIAPVSLGLVSTIAVMGVIVTRYREEGYT